MLTKQTHSSPGNVLKSHLCSTVAFKQLFKTKYKDFTDWEILIITFKNPDNIGRSAHEKYYK